MEPYEAQDCIDALRLAIAGSSNDKTIIRMTEWIVERAPESNGRSTRGVALLVEGITDLQGQITVP